MIIKLTIAGLPKRTNNLRSHWTHRMTEAKKWKKKVEEAVVYGRLQPAKPLTKAKLTLTRHSSMRPDSDGLVSSFKHVIDGLIEADVLVDDAFENIGMPVYLWLRAPPCKGFITIEVEG